MSSQSAKRYARIAGILFLLSMFGGGFGEMYAPSKLIVAKDAAATAANLTNNEFFFRAGFAAYLVEAICDVALAWIFYVLLRPVHRELALLAAFFGLVATSVFGAAELSYYWSVLPLQNAEALNAFTADQRNALALISMKQYAAGAALFLAMYGIAMLLRGVLIFRSGYLPRFLGVLMAIGGAGFILRNFLFLLAPRYATPLLLLPMGLAGLTLTIWFLVKGIDDAKWEARAAASA